jgi:hypothetical protein
MMLRDAFLLDTLLLFDLFLKLQTILVIHGSKKYVWRSGEWHAGLDCSILWYGV